MTIIFSQIVAPQLRGSSRSAFSVKALDLAPLADLKSPVLVCDDFRVSGRPFPPHPHAGFSAVTYVFADSAGALRSRDSLGNDIVVGPGGIVWTQAGKGVIHHEMPGDDRELHGLQLFVNLSSSNKLAEPQTMKLKGSEVPQWRSEGGDTARVVVGSYGGLASPLVPAEPFTLLDVTLFYRFTYELTRGKVAVVYVVDGDVTIDGDDQTRQLSEGQAIALTGDGRVELTAITGAQLILMSGAAIREPVVIDGPFIMNDSDQIATAYARYRSGRMGSLPPM
ncbi:pirin family protein [Bradyrhizobium oligotrophicum S58]